MTTLFYYTILLTDAPTVVSLQAQFPNGIQVAPATAAATYSAPLGGQTPGGGLVAPAITLNSFPPPTLIPISQSQLVAGGTFANGWTDQFGNVYPPNDWAWVGFFLLSAA